MLRNTSYLVHLDTFLFVRVVAGWIPIIYFEHLQIMRIKFLVLIHVPHTIGLPELPIECLPWLSAGPRARPGPRGTKVVRVPEK